MPDRTADIFIWNKIERILFNPEKKKNDLSKWFNQYHKFVLKLWGLNPEFSNRKEYSINFDNKITVSFTTPFKLPKFIIDFKQGDAKQSFHYDEQFISELDLINIFNSGMDKKNNSGMDKKKLKVLNEQEPTQEDITRILTSMVAHPALHIHLESVSNFIRINFNTKNPFLFLYQLAFQLADHKTDFKDSKLKQKEFNKLIELVKNNIETETRIPSGELFKVVKV
jgi:hypothetical protein